VRRTCVIGGPALSRRIGAKGFVVGWERLNPVLRVFLLAAVGFFSYEFVFFHFVLHKTWTAASFYVVER